MKETILKKLQTLTSEEKQGLFLNFMVYGYNMVSIKGESFQADELEILRSFIEAGVHVNQKNSAGAAPLIFVHTKSKSKEMAKLLIQAGADVNTKNKYGNTPLFYAPSKELVELLIQHGADVNAINNQQNTPLHLESKSEIIELLIQAGADLSAKNEDGYPPAEFHRQNDDSDLADFIEQKAIEFEQKKLNQTLPNAPKNLNKTKLHL